VGSVVRAASEGERASGEGAKERAARNDEGVHAAEDRPRAPPVEASPDALVAVVDESGALRSERCPGDTVGRAPGTKTYLRVVEIWGIAAKRTPLGR
jgi:hypothetical protein